MNSATPKPLTIEGVREMREKLVADELNRVDREIIGFADEVTAVLDKIRAKAGSDECRERATEVKNRFTELVSGIKQRHGITE